MKARREGGVHEVSPRMSMNAHDEAFTFLFSGVHVHARDPNFLVESAQFFFSRRDSYFPHISFQELIAMKYEICMVGWPSGLRR